SLWKQHSVEPNELDSYWPAILQAAGVAEQAHTWPAQKLLDYGNAVLESLRPGMAYVGGSDPGLYIPMLLNETCDDGERHIILTQNGLASTDYLNYLSAVYGDRMAALTQEDRQRAIQGYITDYQKRFAHDQEFPNEPKQVYPGEDVRTL